MSPKIVGFCGYPGSGKDEAAKILIAHGWQRLAFADKLRAVALGSDPMIHVFPEEHASIGTNPQILINKGAFCSGGHYFIRLTALLKVVDWHAAKKCADVRRFLQKLGTEGVRDNLGINSWVDAAERSIEVGTRVVFTDTRFPNEAEMIRSRGGKLYWMDRRSIDRTHQHSSEDYPFEFDGTLRNDGTIADLHNKVLELVGISL